MTATKKNSVQPVPTYRVFVSSTYSDMQKYRDAISNALLKANCMPVGMEWFGATTTPPIETCYSELSSCQIYLCALGMRYGEVDVTTQKSFTHLEFEKAEALGMPMLVFLIDGEKAIFKASEFETGEGAKKLELFKERITKSKAVTCAFFSSPSDLETGVLQAITKEVRRLNNAVKEKDTYIEGAKQFRRFATRPASYRDQEAILRVRFDGEYGGWRLNPSIARAFGFEPGRVLFLNDVFTLGIKPNVDIENWVVDCFASDTAADWLDENEVETGTIFEGRFRFAYENVKNVAGLRGVNHAIDAKIANLILVEGLKVVSRDVNTLQMPDDKKSYSISEDYAIIEDAKE